MSYKGVVIEESLEKKDVLEAVTILSTKVEAVTERHRTPWLEQWTLHTIEIPERQAKKVATLLSENLENEHAWYADFKNRRYHYIIFRGKVFKVDRTKRNEYEAVTKYGVSLGIPDYQLDFSPGVL